MLNHKLPVFILTLLLIQNTYAHDFFKTWTHLLHAKNNYSKISDPNFFIERKFKDPTAELNLHKKKFISDSSLKCIFPARYLLLSKEYNWPNPDFSSCPDLSDFISKVPAQKISIIYASENITIPSSMMGHLFIKFSGNKPNESIDYEHSLSFFTDVDGVNFVKLSYESLITGKKGYLIISPFEELKKNYLEIEQRNLWEYAVDYNEFQAKLLLLHIYELKNIKMNYYFHSNNCSTVINDLLLIGHPSLESNQKSWVSPLNVVRNFEQNNLINEIKFYPTSKWKIKNLSELKSNVSGDDQDLQEYINYKLNEAKINYNYEKGNSTFEEYLGEIKNLNTDVKDKYFININEYKKPHLSPRDSQLILSQYSLAQNQNYLLEYMPVSHSLMDDNSQYSNESELKLLSPKILINVIENNFILNSFTFFSAKNITTFNTDFFSWASNIKISYDRIDLLTNKTKGFNFTGGLGLAKTYMTDLDAFFLLNTQISEKNEAFTLIPELGLIVREFANMKSFISLSSNYTPASESKKFENIINFNHAINLKTTAIEYNYQKSSNSDFDFSEIKFKVIF